MKESWSGETDMWDNRFGLCARSLVSRLTSTHHKHYVGIFWWNDIDHKWFEWVWCVGGWANRIFFLFVSLFFFFTENDRKPSKVWIWINRLSNSPYLAIYPLVSDELLNWWTCSWFTICRFPFLKCKNTIFHWMLAVLLWLCFNTLLQCSELARLRISRFLQLACQEMVIWKWICTSIFQANYSLISTTS